MHEQSSIQIMKDWAKGRVDEMNAVLSAVEGQMGRVSADGRRDAEQAVEEMRRQRDRIEAQVREVQDWNMAMAAFEDLKGRIASGWAQFESAAQKAVDAAHKEKEAFEARAKTQMKAWQTSVEAFQEAAQDVQSRQRTEFEFALRNLQAQALAARQRLDSVSGAGAFSWQSLSSALNDSRSALEKANMEAYEAWKKAMGV